MDERVGKEDISFFRFEFKQDLHQILHNFNKEEMLLLNYLMYENTTKKDLAMRLGITRPTLDSKFKKLRNKLSNLLPEYGAGENRQRKASKAFRPYGLRRVPRGSANIEFRPRP